MAPLTGADKTTDKPVLRGKIGDDSGRLSREADHRTAGTSLGCREGTGRETALWAATAAADRGASADEADAWAESPALEGLGEQAPARAPRKGSREHSDATEGRTRRGLGTHLASWRSLVTSKSGFSAVMRNEARAQRAKRAREKQRGAGSPGRFAQRGGSQTFRSQAPFKETEGPKELFFTWVVSFNT